MKYRITDILLLTTCVALGCWIGIERRERQRIQILQQTLLNQHHEFIHDNDAIREQCYRRLLDADRRLWMQVERLDDRISKESK